MCLVLQGAPADEYSKSDNNHVTAAGSKLELTNSQMNATAASKTGLSDSKGDIGPYTWSQAYPGTTRADVQAGTASFDGLGQIINPSQSSESDRDTSVVPDTDTGLLSSDAALYAAGPSSVAARSTCVSNSRCTDSWRASTECSESITQGHHAEHHGCQVKAQSDAFA